MSPSPIRITFDTNAYSPITQPQLTRLITTGWRLTSDRRKSKLRRISSWYFNWCIRRGRILAAIPEAAFAAEVLQNIERIDLILAIGTSKAANPPPIPEGRRALIQKALGMGFRVQHGARIAYGELVGVQRGQWASDDLFPAEERQKRSTNFLSHFLDYPKDSLRDLGEKLSAIHGLAAKNPHLAQDAAMLKVSLDRFLWREGFAAEKQSQRMHASSDSFKNVVRDRLSDWADFDMAATHYAYGYDLLCTDDKGNPRSNSIFGSTYATDVTGRFGVRTISVIDLAALCWRRFRFPLRTWEYTPAATP